MILHLLFDDVFGDYAIQHFSKQEMHSEIVAINYSTTCSFIHEPVRIILVESSEYEELKNNLGAYCAVVFHGLFFPWQADLLQSIPDHVKIAWVFWGGDIYDRVSLRNNFLSPLSKGLLAFQSVKRIIRGVRLPTKYEIPIELVKKIDYCLTDVPEDFAFIKKYLGTSIKELWYNYYSVEETIGNLVDSECNGTNVLIGNSCSITCNHIDGLRIIRKKHLPAESKVYVPLSYGEAWLKKAILKWGHVLLGKQFTPLTSFLPREEYNKIIKSCAVVVMPNYRPQAFGNVLTALWLGSRVFLSEQNFLFSFFKRIGAVVFSIENELIDSSIAPLSAAERSKNRQVISSLYGKDVMYQKNLEIVRILNQ